MDGSIGGGVDPIVEIYRLAKFGLNCLWTDYTSRVPIPCWAVDDVNGGPPPVVDWFKTSNAVLNSYPETYRLLVEILDGIRKLRRTQTVGELVFRTLAREQRDGAYIDQATRIIERGAGLFLRLSEIPNPTVQTEVSCWNLHERCRQIWFEFGYEREEFEGLFARLDWERSTIDSDRRPTYQPEQTPPGVSDSQPPPSAIGLATCWCDKPRNLGGPTNSQATFVDLLIKNGGGMSHADLSVSGGFDWEDSRKGATNMAKRINQTLTNRGELWSIIPEDNSRCLIVLNSELETRS
jgi:hypothetical protein